jgi:hypothetical protein
MQNHQHFEASNEFSSRATNSNTSALPPGLTVGVNAVAVGAGAGDGDEYDNSAYNLSVTTEKSHFISRYS